MSIKGWKHAGSDLANWRRESRNPYKLVPLNKDGTERRNHSPSHLDLHSSEEDAVRQHHNVVKLNPNRTIGHAIYNGSDLIGKYVGGKKLEEETINESSKEEMRAMLAALTAGKKATKIPDGAHSGIKSADWKKASQTGEKIVADRTTINDPHTFVPSATFKGTHTGKRKNLDEVTKKLLGRYINKAAGDVDSTSYSLGRNDAAADDPSRSSDQKARYKKHAEKDERDIMKRRTGIARATNKLVGRAKVSATNEEAINEISQELARSYMKKAGSDRLDYSRKAAMHFSDAGRHGSPETIEKGLKAAKKAKNRAKGYEKAFGINLNHVMKNIKEEEMNRKEINEVSKALLGRYIDKASMNMATNAHVAANKTNDALSYIRTPRTSFVTPEKKNQVYNDMVNSAMDKEKKVLKRHAGIKKAVKKLTNEDIISEVSRDLLTRYISRAGDSIGKHERLSDHYSRRSKRYGDKAAIASLDHEYAATKRGGYVQLAKKKKWGDKNYGLPEPKVKATNEENISESSKEKKAKFLDSVAKVERQSRAAGNFYWNSSHHPKEVDKAKEKHGRRMELAKKVFKRYQTQDISEVSKELLHRYKFKAMDDVDDLRRKTVVGGSREDKDKFYAKLDKKIDNRFDGIDLANKKLKLRANVNATNEEEEINEVSKALLGRYIKDASKHASYKVGQAYSAAPHAEKFNKVWGPRYADENKALQKVKRNFKKADQRHAGIEKAVDKLTGKAKVSATNEENISEVSKALLSRYIDKSTSDIHNQGYKSGVAYANEKGKKAGNAVYKSLTRQIGVNKAVDKLTGKAKVKASE